MHHIWKPLVRLSAVTVLASLVAACGFTPIYAERGQSITQSLTQIDILPIESESDAGFILLSSLRKRMSTGSPSLYTLDVTLNERTRSEAITRQAEVTQFSVNLAASYVLRDREGNIVSRGTKRSFASYGAVPSNYATQVAKEEATRNAADELAGEIELDLVLFFRGLQQ